MRCPNGIQFSSSDDLMPTGPWDDSDILVFILDKKQIGTRRR